MQMLKEKTIQKERREMKKIRRFIVSVTNRVTVM